MKRIVLHGELAKHVPGGVFECMFNTAREAASAIESNYPGFYKLIQDQYIYVRPGEQKTTLNEHQLSNWTIASEELHIIPAIDGEGGGGGGGDNNNTLKAVLGAALIAVAIIGTGGIAAIGSGSLGSTVSLGGFSMGLTGFQVLQAGIPLLMSAFAPAPAGANRDENIKNVIFTGPLNTSNEGAVLPYVAGERVIVGGVIINTELVVESTGAAA
jgi:predicted phage tail protein